MVDLYLLAGLVGLAVFAVDRLRILGWFFGLVEQRTVQAAYATGSAAAVIRRVVTRSAPTLWEVAKGSRIVCSGGAARFGSHPGLTGEMTVTGARWVRQKVAGMSTADWREYSLEGAGETGLLVVLKFMNKIVLMRRLRPDQFAEGCTTVDEVERFVLRHNQSGMTLQGGPDHEALKVGRVGPVRYQDGDWPATFGGPSYGAESFLAGSEDKTRQLLARKEGGKLHLWYGQTVDPERLAVRPAEGVGKERR